MVDVPIPASRRDALFSRPSDGRMFPLSPSEAAAQTPAGLTYAGGVSHAPASVRFYNPGAIGRRSDDAHLSFGALATADLPGSDGKPLSTPAFENPADGVAYYGYYIQARVGNNPTINSIIDAYSTGHPEAYRDHIVKSTGLNADDALTDDTLAEVAQSMFEWESGGTSPSSMNAQALNAMLDGVDIRGEIKRGRAAAKGKGFGEAARAQMADVASTDEALPPVPEMRKDVLVKVPRETVYGTGDFANLALGEDIDLTPTDPSQYVPRQPDVSGELSELSGFDEVRRLLMEPPVRIEYRN